jgi:hypothetical protein
VITPSIWPTPTGRDWKDGSAKACANIAVNGLLGPARIANILDTVEKLASRRDGSHTKTEDEKSGFSGCES